MIRKTSPRLTMLAFAIAACTALSACGGDDPASGAQQADTAIGRAVASATADAREKLAKENMDIGSVPGLPKAEISPQGDLLIDGKAVPLDDAQRKLVLDYRNRLSEVALAGIAVGVEGADLPGKAINETISGLLSGKPEEIEKKMEAEAKKIEASAMKLCEAMPGLLDAQNKLAEALPAFKPYARMDQTDVDDCGKNGSGIADIGGSDTGDAASEAEAATAESAAAEAAKVTEAAEQAEKAR
jgi:hypothetical protein